MAALAINAFYDKPSDCVRVSFYKHNAGVQQTIVSGSIELKQNGQVLNTIEVDGSCFLVTFFHPKGRSGLSVTATIDAIVQDATVRTNAEFSTPIASVAQQGQPTDTEYMWRQPQLETVDTTKRAPGSVILNFDFSGIPGLVYSGGNRVVFNDLGVLVHQPLDQMVSGAKYVEVGTTNLLPELKDLFEYSYPYSAVNQYVQKSQFGYDELLIRALGAAQGDNTEPRTFSATLKTPVAGGLSAQMLLSFTRPLSVEQFNFVTEVVNGNTVLETNTQVLDVDDFVQNYGLVSAVMTVAGDLRFRIEIPGLYPIDSFDLHVLMPQITDLETITSYTPDVRVADVYKSDDVTLDYDFTKIDMSLQVGENLPGYLFDLGTVNARYDGTVLSFTAGDKTITHTVSLKDHNNYGFSFNKFDNVLQILIDGVPVSTGGADFVLTTNSYLTIGCDQNGNSQINAQLYTFKITRG